MTKQLHVLLAEESKRDCLLFSRALGEIPVPTVLKSVNDGRELMKYLLKTETLPDLIFLDFNMPCKSGAECLAEIKQNKKLRRIPIIVYSDLLHLDVADILYEQGAHYYIRKMEYTELKLTLHKILNMYKKTEFTRPSRKRFVFNVVEA